MARKNRTKVQKIGPCPSELSPAARDEWERVLPELIAQDRITPLDLAVLAIYCTSYANLLEAESMVIKLGKIIKSRNDYPTLSPYVILANQYREATLRSAAELGLTPASRLKFPRRSTSLLEPWSDDELGLMPLRLSNS
jgi:P27 family predicted phage terminase small subunit